MMGDSGRNQSVERAGQLMEPAPELGDPGMNRVEAVWAE